MRCHTSDKDANKGLMQVRGPNTGLTLTAMSHFGRNVIWPSTCKGEDKANIGKLPRINYIRPPANNRRRRAALAFCLHDSCQSTSPCKWLITQEIGCLVEKPSGGVGFPPTLAAQRYIYVADFIPTRRQICTNPYRKSPQVSASRRS